MILDSENLKRIKTALKFHSKGLNISEIAAMLKINRNSAAKYLEILMITGQVEAKTQGPSKVYTISQRLPLSAMLNLSSGMILILDRDGRIIQANERFLAFAGTSREEISGRPIQETGLECFRNFPLKEFLEHSGGEKNVIEKNARSHGMDKFLRITVIPTIFDNGDEGLILFLDDITDRRNADQVLREREQLYRSVIENIQDVFYRSDRNGNLIMASPSWATLLGYDSVDDCTGRSIAECFYTEPEKRRELLGILEEKGFVRDYSVELKCRDGTPLPVSTNSHLYYDENGQVLGVEGIFRDMREQARAQKRIQSYITDMEFLSQKLMEFLEIPPESDIYGKIAADLQVLVPGSVVIVGSYNEAAGTAVIRSIPDDDARKRSALLLGHDLVGTGLPVSAVGLSIYRSGKLEKCTQPMLEAAFRTIPEKTHREFAELLGLRNIFAIGLNRGNETFGGAVIYTREGSSIGNAGLVETYIRQASIALQRRIAEDSYRQSQELFFSVAELLPLPLAILDAKGTFTYFNQSFSRLFGYDHGDFSTLREWLNLAFPDPQSRSRITGGEGGEAEYPRPAAIRQGTYTVRCRDGTDREIVFLPVTLDGGNTCIVYEDITGRRAAENVRKLLSAIVTSTDDAIIGKKPDGTILSWNPAAERLYGYRADEAIGQNISILIPAALRSEMKTIMEQIQQGRSVSTLETSRIRRDGEMIDVAVTVSPIMDENGTVIGASSIARDISGIKTEERLRESEERYQSLVENINVGVYRSTGDPRGRFVWGNPSLFRILGYPSMDSLASRDIAALFAEPGGRAGLLDELRASGFVRNREIRLRKPDGTIITVLVTALAKVAKDGTIEQISGLVEDVTERFRAKRLIRTREKEITDILDLLQDPAYIIGTDKTVVAWNTAMERFTGMAKERMLGKAGYPLAIPIYGKNRPALIDCLTMDAGEIAPYYPDLNRRNAAIETELFSPDHHQGSGAVFRITAAPLVNPAGTRVGALEIIRDISAGAPGPEKSGQPLSPAFASYVRKGGPVRMMQAASDRQIPPMISLLYLSNALKLAHDGILIMDRSARCVWVNNSLVQIFGMDESTPVIGKSITSFIAAGEHRMLHEKLFSMEKNGPVSVGLSIITPSGPRPAEASFSNISDEAGELLGYMAIIRGNRDSAGSPDTRAGSPEEKGLNL